MENTYWSILILSILDVGIMLLGYQLDKHYHRQICEPFTIRIFFINKGYDEPLNRFLLSKGGVLILSVMLLVTMMLSKIGS
ncbi:hypothetical protein Mucpa_5573 [Mucilaginibacter paludis DSM 18603]|uniref:Uncharacterized protein n=1 Tax=Mucilaginibacter paludis DSM 18603 TaxID=714943 RepID=H1YC81_9SPHI|nr:hypothetical protein Mucpa_5573 [Mucilaginibacter paludis DSM 18603]